MTSTMAYFSIRLIKPLYRGRLCDSYCWCDYDYITSGRGMCDWQILLCIVLLYWYS